MRTPVTSKQRRRLWAWRVGLGLVVALVLGWAPYQLYRRSDWAHYFKLRAELAALNAGNQKLAEENQRLRTELESFGATDKDGTMPLSVVERIARDELGLVRPGEIVFQLEGDTAPTPAKAGNP